MKFDAYIETTQNNPDQFSITAQTPIDAGDASTAERPLADQLKVVYRRIEDLLAQDRNPRMHSRKQIIQIAASIRRFGFNNPILVDQDGRIIAGHGRLLAAKNCQLEFVPTICLQHMTEAEKRAYLLADNRLAELAGWDKDLLAIELKYIAELDVSLDLTDFGFETAELDLAFTTAEGIDEADEPLPGHDLPTVSRRGDLWLLGQHRLLCGDATESVDFSRLMAGEKAQLIFTDPPYNVPIDRHVCGLGSVHHADFRMASGEMSEQEFTEFLTKICRNLAEHSINGSIHYLCMDWRHLPEILMAGRSVYAELKNICVWNKDNGGMGSFYRSKHELVLVFKNGTASHVNNILLGQHGRYRTNVWDYPGVNSLHADRQEMLQMHPTVKPVALIADAIMDCSQRGALVLDCFLGSGSTLIAAEQTGRRSYGMELEPRYVDTAIRRWQNHTGQYAVHADTGEPFPDIDKQIVTDDDHGE